MARVDVYPQYLPRNLTPPQTSIWENLEISARRYGAKPAFICYDNAITFGELKAECEKLAGFLQKKCGVAKGDRVLLFAQNSIQFVISYYAILRANAVVVPINPMNLTEELRKYVDDCGAKVAIVAQELWPQMAPVGIGHVIVAAYSDYLPKPTDLKIPDAFKLPRQMIGGPGVTLWSDALAQNLAPGEHTVGPDDLCVLPYTSGTTGEPKGCMHTHRSVMHTAVGGGEWFRTVPEVTYLGVLPWFHVTGMQNSMNTPIYMGGTVVMLPRWDREVAGELIKRHRIQAWTLIPTMVVDLLASPNAASFDLSSVQRMTGGGAPMPEAVATRLKELLGITFVEGYGLTETMAPTHVNPPDRPKKQCLGIPIFDTAAMVVDPVTLEELPVGEVGEIVSSGPQIFKGYWGKPQATAEAFFERDGRRFFRTGDLGRMDEEGYFFLVDRLKRMINCSGLKVWPAEVEMLLYGHPDVQEACVVAAKDPRRGETVKAYVVLKAPRRGQVSAEEIIKWAHGKMATYKVPTIIAFEESLPKSATGKIQWRLLQEREKSMRALLCRELTGIDALRVEEIASPSPGANEVVITVKAAGVNFPDVLLVQGKYQFKAPLPFAPGFELAGVVKAVGADVKHVKAGDHVLAVVTHGAFAQEVLAPAERVMPIPASLDLELAAAMMFTYGTSLHALKDRGELKAGQTLLVLGAAGGVGLAAVELGKLMGARVIAAASSPEKLEVCRAMGADVLIDYATGDFREKLKAVGPMDVVYDPVGGAYTEPALRSLGWKGRHLVVGFAAGDIPKIPLNLPLLKGSSIVGVFWGAFLQNEPAASRANAKQLVEWLATGKIKPHISGRYPLDNAVEALREVQDRRAKGKVLVIP